MQLDYASIRQTLDFLLYDWLEVEALSRHARYAGHDRQTYGAVLDMCERLAADKFEPFNRLVDQQEPHFDGQQLICPIAHRRPAPPMPNRACWRHRTTTR